jgi:hypothetical protein
MHPEDAGIDRLDNTTDAADELDANRSLWWALHRPETYALTAMAMALAALFGLLPGFEIAQAFDVGLNGIRGPLAVTAGVRLALAVIAAALAVRSIATEDEDVTWSAPVARASLAVSVVATLFSAITIVGLLTHDGDPDRFGG